jgi:hypothetical protein
VFEGDEVTYYFASSEQGGMADVYIDGVKRTSIDYSGTAPGNAPEFGRSVTFGELGGGAHEILIEFRSGAVYVDGFEIVSGSEGGADDSAAETRSETTTSSKSFPLLGAKVVSQTVNVGADDEWLSVVVEGAQGLLTVKLLDSLGNLAAAGDQLLGNSSAVGLDVPAPAAGTYTVQVLGSVTSATAVEISVARTITVQ